MARAKPGTTDEGEYYRVVVRPKNQFTTFRTHDIGRPGRTQRLVGRRSSGSWATHAWLIQKSDAYVNQENVQIILTNNDIAEDLSNAFRGTIYREKGDVFRAKPRKNVPEKNKPTPEQKRARRENIEKAQRAH